jgi:glucose-1-phosphate thymidylyltransferase
MVYYPMSLLMLAGIREVLVISTPRDLPAFEELLGDGSRLGMRFAYCEQPRPEGLAQAFLLAREFLDGGPAALVLGDNILFGHGVSGLLRESVEAIKHGARIFAYRVRDPERYGVVEFDRDGRAVSLEEKPQRPRSAYAVPGLYFYGPDVCELAASLRPSARGELEITDLNRIYLERGELDVGVLGRGVAWLDAGTPRSLLDAATFIAAIEERQGLKVGCLEEIAWNNGWITDDGVLTEAKRLVGTDYGGFLTSLIVERKEVTGGAS